MKDKIENIETILIIVSFVLVVCTFITNLFC